jgi:Mg-chelatase subunit ChlD
MTPHRFAATARWLVSFAVAAVATFALVASRAGAAWWGDGDQPPTPAPTARSQIEVAFVLDTTGSMSGLIEGAKRKIWSIASHLARAGADTGLRVALVGYRDRGDDYVTLRLDLTPDLDALYARLLQIEAGGGGDTPESVNQALHEAVTKLSWSRGGRAYRVIFLVGDAPPHTDYGDDVPYAESVRAARQRGIAVNTIQCGDLQETTPFWMEIARIGAGEYAAIAQDGGMVAVTTPMDEELSRLNRDLAGTVVGYGSDEQRRALRSKVRHALEAPAGAAAERLSYLSKREKNVVSGESDLVDAARQGLDVGSLPQEALPAEMQEMAGEERRAYVAQKAEERARIQRRIDALTQERDAWLRERAQEEAGPRDAFDEQVLSAMRAQAAEKGIGWE